MKIWLPITVILIFAGSIGLGVFLKFRQQPTLINPMVLKVNPEGFSDYISESTVSESTPTITPVAASDTLIKGLTAEQKRRVEQIISLFENGTIEISYSYAKNLDDGRGITCGRAGFTTRDGDAHEVVSLYTTKKPDNKLAKYLKTLRKLSENDSDSTKDLKGFEAAWKESAQDTVFKKAQDYVVDQLYFLPSQKYADELNLNTAFSRLVLYDTIIQHGDGDDKDSTRSLISSTNKAKGVPNTREAELKWIETFLANRKKVLEHASEEDTRDEWAESVDRVVALKQILDAKNYDLTGPIKIDAGDFKGIIP